MYPDIGAGEIPAKKFSMNDAKNFLELAVEVLICIKKML